MSDTQRPLVLKTLYIMFITLLLLFCFFYRSINLYWEQTYHDDSYLTQITEQFDLEAFQMVVDKITEGKIQLLSIYDEIEQMIDEFYHNSAMLTQEEATQPEDFLTPAFALKDTNPPMTLVNKNQLMIESSDQFIVTTTTTTTTITTVTTVTTTSKKNVKSNVNKENEISKETTTTSRVSESVKQEATPKIDNASQSEIQTSKTNKINEIKESKKNNITNKEKSSDLMGSKNSSQKENREDLKKEKIIEEKPEEGPQKQLTDPLNNQIQLHPEDMVLFVGDSLMQGVAPHVKSALYRRYHIKSIDLSKQSTGLSYPGFFNWPETVAKTFSNNVKIALMVVMLGPNDPWSFPEQKNYKKAAKKHWLPYKSIEWETHYVERINSILQIAKRYKAQVIWIGAPNMKRDSLNSAMQYLNGLYQTETLKNGNIYLDINDVLGNNDSEFNEFITIEKANKVKVRTDDGIHFTIPGQRLISKKVLSYINFVAE